MTEYRDYPVAQDERSGCKVGWRTYAKREDAQACAKAALWNAKIQWDLGYDFGYCTPGSITELDDGRFEVCIP